MLQLYELQVADILPLNYPPLLGMRSIKRTGRAGSPSQPRGALAESALLFAGKFVSLQLSLSRNLLSFYGQYSVDKVV